MEKKINGKALVIALALALITCFLLISYVNGMKKPAAEVEKVKLLVAARNIEPGTQITNTDVNAVDISVDSMPQGVLNDRTSIEGMYANEPILAGEPFRGERLKTKEEMSLSWNIPDKMRALTIFVNEDGIFSTQLKVGDHVDVVGSFKTDVGESTPIASSLIIVQNAQILAIGQNRSGQGLAEVQAKTTDGSEKLPLTVTLAVTSDDAEKVVFATDFGEFSLLLRGNGDTDKTNTKGTLIEDVIPSRLVLYKQIKSQESNQTTQK